MTLEEEEEERKIFAMLNPGFPSFKIKEAPCCYERRNYQEGSSEIHEVDDESENSEDEDEDVPDLVEVLPPAILLLPIPSSQIVDEEEPTQIDEPICWKAVVSKAMTPLPSENEQKERMGLRRQNKKARVL